MKIISKHTILLVTYLSLIACSSVSKNTHLNAQLLSDNKYVYQKIAKASWPVLETKHNIFPNEAHKLIPQIRERLIKLADIPSNYDYMKDNFYDNTLKEGVKQFQKRHGLNSDGVIGSSTLMALNIPPAERLAQITNAQAEWQKLPSNEDMNDYININLPSYLLNIYKGAEKNLEMKVVVGSKNWPTPLLTSEIKTVVINPTWNIPRNIAEKEIIHKIADNIDYLKEENIRIIDGWHKGAKQIEPLTVDWQSYTGKDDLPFRLVQGAGDDNALGSIKFTFPNSEHIYLHDTPNKGAFKVSKRNLSHGCIRLEEPIKLLNYLFENNHLDKEEKINNELASKVKTKHYALKKSLPIYITHINAWVDKEGLLNFRH